MVTAGPFDGDQAIAHVVLLQGSSNLVDGRIEFDAVEQSEGDWAH